MMNLQEQLIEKGKLKHYIEYMVFGLATTVINIVVFYISRKFNLSVILSNVIATVLAITFAYVTNKNIVFKSSNKNKMEFIKELIQFFGFRVLFMGIDTAFVYYGIQKLMINETIVKIASNIIIVICNYLVSKLVIFNHGRGNKNAELRKYNTV